MTQLHLVGFTPDLGGLALSTRKGARSGTYQVTVDDELVGHVKELLRLRDVAAQQAGDDGSQRGRIGRWRGRGEVMLAFGDADRIRPRPR